MVLKGRAISQARRRLCCACVCELPCVVCSAGRSSADVVGSCENLSGWPRQNMNRAPGAHPRMYNPRRIRELSRITGPNFKPYASDSLTKVSADGNTPKNKPRLPQKYPSPSVRGHERWTSGAHPLQPPVSRHKPRYHPAGGLAPSVVKGHGASAEADGEQVATWRAEGHPFRAERRGADGCSSARHARELQALFSRVVDGRKRDTQLG